MKCEITRRVKVNAEEKEKIEYIKKELEKKGLIVRISVIDEENGEVEYLGRDISKMPEMWKMPGMPGMPGMPEISGMWESKNIMKPTEIKDPREISNPYRSFKEMLDKEKEKSMNKLKGGKKGGEPIPGLKYELKEVTIKIEVET